jgi:hypothetical protein
MPRYARDTAELLPPGDHDKDSARPPGAGRTNASDADLAKSVGVDKWWDERSKEQIRQEWWDEVTDPASYIAAAILRLGDRSELLAQRLVRLGPAILVAAAGSGLLVALEPQIHIEAPGAFAIALAATGTATLLPGQVEWLRYKGQLPGTGYPKKLRKWMWSVEAIALLVTIIAHGFSHHEPTHSVAVAVGSVCLADLSVPGVCWMFLWGIDPHVGRTLLRPRRGNLERPANIQLVESICAEWERGKFRSTRWAHPAIDFKVSSGPSPSSGAGVVQLKQSLRAWSRAWVPSRITYRYGEHVVVGIVFSERRGVPANESETAWLIVFHVRQGKVTRLEIDNDPDRALDALDLPPG